MFSENEAVTVVTRRITAGERRMTRTADTRITGHEPLLSPADLLDELPLGEEASLMVDASHGNSGKDHRRQPVRSRRNSWCRTSPAPAPVTPPAAAGSARGHARMIHAFDERNVSASRHRPCPLGD